MINFCKSRYHKLQVKTGEDWYLLFWGPVLTSWQATNYLSKSTRQKITLTGQIMLEILNSLATNNANGGLKNTKMYVICHCLGAKLSWDQTVRTTLMFK